MVIQECRTRFLSQSVIYIHSISVVLLQVYVRGQGRLPGSWSLPCNDIILQEATIKMAIRPIIADHKNTGCTFVGSAIIEDLLKGSYQCMLTSNEAS